MHGTYQHCGEAHLHRYLANLISDIIAAQLGISDGERAADAVRGAEASASCTVNLVKPKTNGSLPQARPHAEKACGQRVNKPLQDYP